ncbi:aromatic acid exporter family protein [Marinicrinis sediminis]|uniref:Aromatic acid exporter family protein n=1 Tax=Marinicrinis sediminis TaxID=1652465 RepID=A0ABW5RD78_9BACL
MGIRILKTAIAAVVAVYIANAFSLQFAMSAALLAILGVDVTKRRSLWNVFQRFTASVLGLLVGCLIFAWIGFYTWVIGIFILIAYPVLSKVRLKDGIVTSSVVVLHVYDYGAVDTSILLNELGLLVIGLGSATVFNLAYMPKSDQQLLRNRALLEDQFSLIFVHIANHLGKKEYVWDGEELILAAQYLQEGEDWSKRAFENALFRENPDWQIYFHMRRQQLDSIERMMDIVSQVYESLPHGELAAQVFLELSEDVKHEYYTGRAERELTELEQQFKGMELPATRAEFEVRSAILQLCVELRHYLSYAKREKKKRREATG